MTRFFVAVPTLNSAEFLGRTLSSLLEAQPGDFDVHVRVQDGGSSDGTLAIAERWARRIVSAEVPDATRRRLSITSGRDGGIYDAVAAAFASSDASEDEVLTWLGADDLLMTGALASVAKLLGRFPEIRWVTGRPQVVDREGAWYTPWPAFGFARRDLRRGLHDGRCLPFVMQEGTFWRAALYREAGGLRRDLRLAGDFDLWRRFARSDDLVECSFPLAAWRWRSGQASGDRAAYDAEVDRVVAEDVVPPIEDDTARDDPALRYRRVMVDRYLGADFELRVDGLPFVPLEGFGYPEAPSPAHGLSAWFVWMVKPTATLRLPIREAGAPYRVAIRFRNPHPDVRITVRLGDAAVHDAAAERAPDAARVIAFTCVPAATEPVLTIECRSEVAPFAPAPGGLLVEDVACCRVRDPALRSSER